MPQYARPSTDTNNSGEWRTQAGSSAALYATLDEVSADDADYIESTTSPVNKVYVTRLSSVADPVASTGYEMQMRSAVDVGSQETLDFTLQLRAGYENESTQGTAIASLSRSGVTSTAFALSSYTLSAVEADAIVDHSSLFYRVLVNKP